MATIEGAIVEVPEMNNRPEFGEKLAAHYAVIEAMLRRLDRRRQQCSLTMAIEIAIAVVSIVCATVYMDAMVALLAAVYFNAARLHWIEREEIKALFVDYCKASKELLETK